MTTYRVTHDRIGRNHNIKPMVFEDVTDPDELAALIFEKGKRHLMSRDVEVAVNLFDLTGFWLAGMRPAGNFTIETVN